MSASFARGVADKVRSGRFDASRDCYVRLGYGNGKGVMQGKWCCD